MKLNYITWMNENIYIDTFLIRNFHIDINGCLSIKYLFDFLLECTKKHGNLLNVGIDELFTQGNTWMLSRMHLQINKFPEENEEIKIKTWPSGTRGIFSRRDYIVENSRNEQILKATSGWLVVNLEKRRPVRLTEQIINIQNNDARRAIKDDFKKFIIPDKFNNEYSSAARLNSIDFNKHFTSSSYVAAIIDALDMDFYKNHRLEQLELDFKTEILPMQSYVVKSNIENNNGKSRINFTIRNKENNTVHLNAKSLWKKN